MEKKWYKDWRSWVTILLILFVPTFLIGVIVMWAAAPWSKRVKWWITVIGIGVPLLGIIISFVLATASPRKQLDVTNDAAKKAEIQDISQQANRYCLNVGKCPVSILELQQKGYLSNKPVDSSIGYVSLNGGKDCVVQTTLSTNQVFSIKCFPVKSP